MRWGDRLSRAAEVTIVSVGCYIPAWAVNPFHGGTAFDYMAHYGSLLGGPFMAAQLTRWNVPQARRRWWAPLVAAGGWASLAMSALIPADSVWSLLVLPVGPFTCALLALGPSEAGSGGAEGTTTRDGLAKRESSSERR